MTTALLTSLLFVPAIASAQATTTFGGFGGVTVNGITTGQRPSLGGNLSFEPTPGVQVIGEAGRIGNVLPLIADTVFSVTDSGIQASAFYGEGGVRILSPRATHLTPYAEATAGMARLSVSSTRLGTWGNAAAQIGVALAGRTTPLVGLGGGLLVRTGPVVFDLGYRYKQLFPNEVLEIALGFGEPLRTHQFRVGLGVRF